MFSNDEPLTRNEASMIVRWMVVELKKSRPDGGFLAFWRKTPTQVSREYKVPLAGLLEAIRRHPETS